MPSTQRLSIEKTPLMSEPLQSRSRQWQMDTPYWRYRAPHLLPTPTRDSELERRSSTYVEPPIRSARPSVLGSWASVNAWSAP